MSGWFHYSPGRNEVAGSNKGFSNWWSWC